MLSKKQYVKSPYYLGDLKMIQLRKNPLLTLLINVIAIVVAYYAAILLHEWGHGTVAWLYGIKQNPFDVHYGGWFLLNVDENVNYTALIQSGRGVTAALIGIAGVTVSFILAIISFRLLNRKSIIKSSMKFAMVYWLLIINMIPLVQYLTIAPFSQEGDTGRFIHGLAISGWWLFIPGTLFIIYALWRILSIEIIKAYAVISIKTLLGRNIFLLITLSIMFLFIYSHGYNPLSDKGMNTLSKGMAIASIILVPILFILCNPARRWVKKALFQFIHY